MKQACSHSGQGASAKESPPSDQLVAMPCEIFLTTNGCRRTACCGYDTPGQVRLGYIRKIAGQGTGGSQASKRWFPVVSASVSVSRLLLEFLPCLHSVIDYDLGQVRSASLYQTDPQLGEKNALPFYRAHKGIRLRNN